jgi:hypothetical protein
LFSKHLAVVYDFFFAERAARPARVAHSMAQISRSLQQACLARFQNIVPVLTLIFGGSQTIRASLNQSDAAIQSFDLFPLVLTCHSKKVLVNTVRRCSLELLSIGALGQSRALRIASEECMGWVRFDPEVVVFLSFVRCAVCGSSCCPSA